MGTDEGVFVGDQEVSDLPWEPGDQRNKLPNPAPAYAYDFICRAIRLTSNNGLRNMG